MSFLLDNWPACLLAAACVAVLVYERRRAAHYRAELARVAQQHQRLLQEQQQQLLAQNQAQLDALFNSMVEGVLILDAQGRIQLANESLKLLLQLTRDVRGQTVISAFRLHDLDAGVTRLLKENCSLTIEIEIPGVRPRFLQVNGATLAGKADGPAGAILVFHDLTRLKQLEKTRQEFVANVSHELRTPLSLIKGFVETLLDGAKDDPSVSTRFLQNIGKHTDRLTFLIEDLLSISRLESAKEMLNLQPTSLHEVAERVIDDLKTRAEQRRVNIENNIPARLLARADADRLQQVFFNLIDNAIKYGPAEGRVTVSAAANGGALQVCVQDNGPGIPPESQERIFERFYRLDKARSRDQGGTGLGLAIVKHIVQAHTGKVWVESKPGQGAAFYFTLPPAAV